MLLSWDVDIEDVTAEDAERAAESWAAGSGLSLADRLCLALGARAGGRVWTADRAWGEAGQVRQIR